MNVSCEDSDELRLCRVSHQEVTQCPPLVVSCSLIVKADHSWILHVHGHAVDPTLTPSLAEIPSLLDISSMSTLLQKVSSLNTCVGNPEAKFVALCETKKNKQFLSASKQVIAYLDSGISVILNGQEYPSTVRCSSCSLLIDGIRCEMCTKYCKNLLTSISRQKNSTEEDSQLQVCTI